MANNQNAVWPLPKFHFQVSFAVAATSPSQPAAALPTTSVAFQEISGLEAEHQVIEYRHSNNPYFSTIKMPGIAKYGNVTMKNGVFVHDNTFWTWYWTHKAMNVNVRMTVTIQLLDETNAPTMTWQLNNAFIVKVQGTDLKSDANEAAIQTMELAHEWLVVENK